MSLPGSCSPPLPTTNFSSPAASAASCHLVAVGNAAPPRPRRPAAVTSLRSQIAERIEAEFAGAARTVLKRQLLDRLDDLVAFELPPSLVEAEAKQIAHQLWHEEHPEVHGHEHGEVEPSDAHQKLAERRVRLGLFLADLGQKTDVEVSDAEMTRAVMQQARQYPGQERQFFEFVQSNPQMQQQLRAPIFEDKVVDHIFAQAQVAEREVSKDDLQKAVEALEDAVE